MDRTCPDCGRTLPPAEFYRSRGGRHTRCKPCYNSYQRRLRQSGQSAPATSAQNKAYQLKWKYGITLDDYDRMVEAQGGVCAICNKAETSVHKTTREVKALAVDHDHVSGKVRGLLCSNCNTALGKFQDDPEILLSAVDYLDAS